MGADMSSVPGFCKTPGCNKSVYILKAGLCRGEYLKYMDSTKPPCTIDGCKNRQRSRGMCNNHHKQWLKSVEAGEEAYTPRATRWAREAAELIEEIEWLLITGGDAENLYTAARFLKRSPATLERALYRAKRPDVIYMLKSQDEMMDA